MSPRTSLGVVDEVTLLAHIAKELARFVASPGLARHVYIDLVGKRLWSCVIGSTSTLAGNVGNNK